MKLALSGLIVALAGAIAAAQGARSGQTIDDFFNNFAAEWVRSNPDQATATRYFTGAEQDRLEQQLMLVTDAYLRARIELASKGLVELGKFDRAGIDRTATRVGGTGAVATADRCRPGALHRLRLPVGADEWRERACRRGADRRTSSLTG